MANVKITELPQVSTILGTDIVPTVASSATSKITIIDFANSLPQVSSSLSASYLSGSSAIVNDLTSSLDLQINGLNFGRGSGNSITNISIGSQNLRANTTGIQNSAIGLNSLDKITTGTRNTAVGANTLNNIISGSYNVALGVGSINNISAGDYNIGLGASAGSSFRTGSRNIFLGASINAAQPGIVSGSFNVLIGTGISGLPADTSNNIVLSDGAGNIKYRWDTIQNNLYGNTVVSGSLFVTGSSPRTVLTDFTGTTQNITASIVAQDSLILSSNSNETIRLSYKNLIANRTNAGYSSNLRGNETNIYAGSTNTLGRLSLIGDLITVNRSDANDISAYTSNAMYGSYAIMNQGSTSTLDSSPKYSALIRSYYSNQNIYQGTVNIAEGFRHLVTIGALNVGNTLVTNYYGLRSSLQIGWTSGIYSSSITNHYGVYLDTPSVNLTGTIINRWGFYAPDPTMKHHVSGTLSIGTVETGSYQLQVVGNTGISGSLDVTGSVQISNVLTLPPQDPLPSSVATGSIAVSGSGIDCKPYFWNGSSWTSMI